MSKPLETDGMRNACGLPSRRYGDANGRRTGILHASLAKIVEDQVLPRLVLIHREDRRACESTTPLPTPEHAVAFAQTLIGDGPDDEWLSAVLKEGLSLDALLVELFAPAARHLGRLWEDDEADLLDVTVALGRIHSLTRALCARLERLDVPTNDRRALLIPCPGETHLFSLTLVASSFRKAGWGVTVSSGDDDDFATLVRTEHFDLIGISLSCDALLPVMTDLVAKLRASSCNPGIRVIVGGPLFSREPACAVTVGADAAAEDGQAAVKIAETLLAR